MFKFGSKKKDSVNMDNVAAAYAACVRIIKSNGYTERTYEEARIRFNQAVIEACLGATIDGDKMKFDKKLPDGDDKVQIISYASSLAETEKILSATSRTADDDDISVMPMRTSSGTAELKKYNAKAVKEYIMGTGGMIGVAIGAADVMRLFDIGKKLRKKQHRNTMLLIGGLAILITGAAVATVLIIRHNSKHTVDEINNPNAGIDDNDIKDIEEVPDNIPDDKDMPYCSEDI